MYGFGINAIRIDRTKSIKCYIQFNGFSFYFAKLFELTEKMGLMDQCVYLCRLLLRYSEDLNNEIFGGEKKQQQQNCSKKLFHTFIHP